MIVLEIISLAISARPLGQQNFARCFGFLNIFPKAAAGVLRKQTNLSSFKINTYQVFQYTQSFSSNSLINLHLGQPSPSLLPHQVLQQAAVHRLDENNKMILQYGAGQGYFEFRECVAKFLEENYQFSVKPEDLMVSCGNSHAISLSCSTFCSGENKDIFVENPSYFLAFDIFREQGIKITPICMDTEGIEVQTIERFIQEGSTPSLVYVIPSFQNPTGISMSQSRILKLVELAQKHDFIILADEPYPLLNCDGAMPSLISQYVDTGHVVSLGSFSKILAPGLRLGWIHSSQDNIKKLMQSAVIRSGGCVNPIMAGIVHSAIEMGHLGSHISALKSVYKSRKRALCDALRFHIPDIQFVEPEGGYFVWCKLPATIDSKRLLEVAKDFSVSFTPGYRCSSIEGFSSHIRLSFAFYTESEIVEGVIRIKKAIEKLKQSHAM